MSKRCKETPCQRYADGKAALVKKLNIEYQQEISC